LFGFEEETYKDQTEDLAVSWCGRLQGRLVLEIFDRVTDDCSPIAIPDQDDILALMKLLSKNFLQGLDVRCTINVRCSFANRGQMDGYDIVAYARETALDLVVDSGLGEGSRDEDEGRFLRVVICRGHRARSCEEREKGGDG
jgi:hypothetical protein